MKQAKKKVMGRPKLRPEERRKGIELSLRKDVIEQARAIGGTVSRGVEMAVTEYWAGLQPKAKRKQSNQSGCPETSRERD